MKELYPLCTRCVHGKYDSGDVLQPSSCACRAPGRSPDWCNKLKYTILKPRNEQPEIKPRDCSDYTPKKFGQNFFRDVHCGTWVLLALVVFVLAVFISIVCLVNPP